jgi:ABC-type uncharacterized transport system permease subunit
MNVFSLRNKSIQDMNWPALVNYVAVGILRQIVSQTLVVQNLLQNRHQTRSQPSNASIKNAVISARSSECQLPFADENHIFRQSML